MRTEALSPTRFTLPGGEALHVQTERWSLEPWNGAPDPPELSATWARKPPFTVGGTRSCAELAVVDHARTEGWDGVWVSAYHNFLRQDWFPAPKIKLTDLDVPAETIAIFERLREANGRNLCGFFDVCLWRQDEVRFAEVKVGSDRITETQRRFVALHQSLGRHLTELLIIEVP